ncbi:Protein of unknown function [Gryllus bimaculatus]|nr:Protein of unknown function [Gryllus bimaculatus]
MTRFSQDQMMERFDARIIKLRPSPGPPPVQSLNVHEFAHSPTTYCLTMATLPVTLLATLYLLPNPQTLKGTWLAMRAGMRWLGECFFGPPPPLDPILLPSLAELLNASETVAFNPQTTDASSDKLPDGSMTSEADGPLGVNRVGESGGGEDKREIEEEEGEGTSSVDDCKTWDNLKIDLLPQANKPTQWDAAHVTVPERVPAHVALPQRVPTPVTVAGRVPAPALVPGRVPAPALVPGRVPRHVAGACGLPPVAAPARLAAQTRPRAARRGRCAARPGGVTSSRPASTRRYALVPPPPPPPLEQGCGMRAAARDASWRAGVSCVSVLDTSAIRPRWR